MTRMLLSHESDVATEAGPPATPTPAPAARPRLVAGLLAASRVVIGFLFACHGAAKLFGWFGGTPAPVGAWPGWWAGAIELVAGVLIATGLFTRVSAVIASGTMAYAYFFVHQKYGVLPLENKGELAALYSWTFLLLAAVGPGAFALDNLRRARPTTT